MFWSLSVFKAVLPWVLDRKEKSLECLALLRPHKLLLLPFLFKILKLPFRFLQFFNQ